MSDMADYSDLLAFVEKAQQLAFEAEQGRKIAKLANGEAVHNPQRDNKPPPEYVKAIRFHAINACFDIYNEQVKASGEGRDIYIGDLVKPVQEKVRFLIGIGAWSFNVPGELTVRRRVEEAANPKYYPETGHPAIVWITEGFYRPSPYYLSPETREALKDSVKVAEFVA